MYNKMMHIAQDQEGIKRSLCTFAGKSQDIALAVKTNRSHLIAHHYTLTQMRARVENTEKEIADMKEGSEHKGKLLEDKLSAMEEATTATMTDIYT
jgi:cell division protein FtsB